MTSVIIMRPEHLPEVARLCEQLGYPSTLAEVEQRFLSLANLSGHCQLVAMIDGELAGWAQLWMEPTNLVEDPQAEIAALVVDENRRGHGIGKALVDAAKTWAIQQGAKELRLSSNAIVTAPLVWG